MFDINGGPENVFTFLNWLFAFFFFVIVPTIMSLFFIIGRGYNKYYSLIALIFSFALWFAMLYVCYPSLTFWKA